jgi:5'-3' exonuclease
MIPGRHYNFVKNQHINISYEEGIKRFYMQLLTGDSTDNIPGLPKVGPKTAEKILNRCDDEECYKEKVFEAYKSKYSDLDDVAILERVNLIGKLLWIRRKEDEDWSF